TWGDPASGGGCCVPLRDTEGGSDPRVGRGVPLRDTEGGSEPRVGRGVAPARPGAIPPTPRAGALRAPPTGRRDPTGRRESTALSSPRRRTRRRRGRCLRAPGLTAGRRPGVAGCPWRRRRA